MATLKIVAVRDRQLDAFSRPYFVPALGLALRSFSDECQREAQDNPLYMHPADFELYELGSFDEESGKFTNLDRPHPIGLASDFVKAP